MLKTPQPTKSERTKKKAFIKSLGVCAAAGLHNTPCCEGLDEAHFKKWSYAGKNMKNHDRTFPMCRMHHTLEGPLGEPGLWGNKLDRMPALTDAIHQAFLNNDRFAARILISEFRQ